MKINLISCLIFLGVVSFLACKKEEDLFLEKSNISVNLRHVVDSQPLLFDTIMYYNLAGNNYQVTKLEYYISNIKLHSDFMGDYTSSEIFYINAGDPSKQSFLLKNVPSGNYSSISYVIGIDSAHNLSYSLPNTNENIGMNWPVGMGGGYHFIKLEGHYIDNSIITGFAIHLGQNSFQTTGVINRDFRLGYAPYQLVLEMNVNEWMQSPHTYNFQSDGNYTMGNSLLMGKISANGTDVLTLKNN